MISERKMTIKVKWKFICSIFISLELAQCISLGDNSPSKDFTAHAVIKPRIYNVRSKREISHTAEPGGRGGHAQDLNLSLDLDGVERIVELTLNHDLIAGSYFQKTQKNGSYHIHKPKPEELELCQYRGYIRHIPDSWAALSTCSGLKGIVYDGNNTYFIDKGPEEGLNYVYNGRDLRSDRNQSCGFPQSHTVTRLKRDASIRGPYNANRQSRYVELLLVVDHEEYRELGDLKAVYQHCKDIANIINSLFVPLNIFIALIGVVVWTDVNEISLTRDGDMTLTNFLHYRREVLVKEHPNDNAQLLTRIQFDEGVVGKALKGPICTFEYSGGVFMDHSNVVGLVATTVAHELGHNFGMEHDGPDCECPDDRCIMAPSSSSMSPTHWSSCSLDYLALAFEHGMDYCLRNKPDKLFDSPVCGNGFVEPGEQCDCGLPHRCDNPCCNSTTCMLHSNASCATGECCDFQTCKPKNAGTVCRTAEHECDLPEYCTGESEYCPGDVFKINGESCNNGKAFCYQGKCRTHSDQCQLLWGPSGNNSDFQCYLKNTIGTRHGNCGYNRLNQTYIKCYNDNVYCGMVHCSHLNEKLEFGMESVSILAHTFINKEGDIIACRTAIVDLGLNEVDPGLAPNGAKCGEGKMCVNQKCMSVGELRKMSPSSCPEDCNGKGVCNSKGHCHCIKGFAPPFCDYPGTGGSTDSGPASDPNMGREFTIALYVIFLCIVPIIALGLIFMYYTKQNAKIWWKKSPTRLNNAPWECKRKSPAGGTAVLLPESVGVVDVGIIQSNRSVTPKVTVLNEMPSQSTPITDLRSNLFGKGKGFTIKPLKKPNNFAEKPNPSDTASLVSPSGPRYENVEEPSVKESAVKIPNRQNSWRNEDGRLRVISPPTLPSDTTYKNVSFSKKPKMVETKQPEDVEVPVVSVPSRPQISEPVLEDTTAKDLISEGTALVPTRKAPEIPKVIEKYEKEPPPVPVHVVETKERPASSPLELPEEKKLLKELKEIKEYSTLVKLASLMKNASNVNRAPSINEKSKSKVKVEPKKIKFDREKLKNIEISNPIPQVEAEEVKKKETNISRAQSMREPNCGKTNIPNFGSLRMGGGKRPTSIHVPNRPTSPPPRPPPPKPSNQEYAYDDCLNLAPGKVAPLAHIDEESTPSPNNIYAVIEESPKLETGRKVHFNDESCNAPGEEEEEAAKGKPLSTTNVPSGSTESMGLLGEIVSEIQARNLDSIYSSGTLKRKKEASEKQENGGLYSANLSSGRSDASSASSGNGYLNPENINTPDGNPEAVEKPPAYKPYSSSLTRNVGPLSNAYTENKSLPSSASPVVKSTFTRPMLLSSPAPPKFTPQDITSSISKPEPPSEGMRTKEAKPAGPKPVVPRSARGTTPPSRKSENEAPTRPLPSPPRKVEVKTAKNPVVSRPLPAIPRKNSKENLTKVKKPPTEKKPEVQRKTSNVAQLQSKFEASSSENRKSISASATEKTKDPKQ